MTEASENYGAFQSLPFVGGRQYWTPPASGGYMGGCMTGEAAAVAYLHHMQARECGGGSLQLVAIAFAERMAQAASDEERTALRGQMVGFFFALDRTLRPFASLLRMDPEWTPERIASAMREGVELDESAYLGKRIRLERSARAKEAARKRRAAR